MLRTHANNFPVIGIDYSCAICEGRDYTLLHSTRGGYTAFNKNKSEFYICNSCGLVLRYPRPREDELLDLFYAVEYWGQKDLSCERLFQPHHAGSLMLDTIQRLSGGPWERKVVVDVGCGFGSLVRTLADDLPSCRIIGIEPDHELAARLNECNKRENVEIIAGSVERLPDDVKPDVVFLMTVFEHLLDPIKGLELLREWLPSDGLVVINVPDVFEPGTLGLDYFFRDFHLFYYSQNTLSAALRKSGFEVVAVQRGGIFKNATAPTLCIVARKTHNRVLNIDPNEVGEIKKRIALVARRTRIAGPLLYIYRYKVRRPFFTTFGKLRNKFAPKGNSIRTMKKSDSNTSI